MWETIAAIIVALGALGGLVCIAGARLSERQARQISDATEAEEAAEAAELKARAAAAELAAQGAPPAKVWSGFDLARGQDFSAEYPVKFYEWPPRRPEAE